MRARRRGDHTGDYVFVGTHGHVLALDQHDGTTVWETSLPKTGYGVVSIVYEQDRLLCAAGGRVFALDPLTGEIIWTNGLPGMSTGVVFLTTVHSNNYEAAMSVLAEQQSGDDAGAASDGY